METYVGADAATNYMQVVFPVAFIALFGPIIPAASVFSLFVLWSQLRAGGYKLLVSFKRVGLIRAQNVGVWDTVPQVFSFATLFNNIALLLTQVDVIGNFIIEKFGVNGKLITFFVLENVVMVCLLVFDRIGPDISNDTRLEIRRLRRRASTKFARQGYHERNQ